MPDMGVLELPSLANNQIAEERHPIDAPPVLSKAIIE